MDTNTVESGTVAFESMPSKEIDINESCKNESEIEERLDEPISDDTPMDEILENKSQNDDCDLVYENEDINRNADKMNDTLDSDFKNDLKLNIDNTKDGISHGELKKVDETVIINDKRKHVINDEDVPDRQLRNSVKIDKPSLSNENEKTKDLSDEKKLDEKPPETPKERKRRYKNFSSSPIKASPDEIIVKSKRKRLQSDKFCWRCHKESAEMNCSACPRSWHRKCIGGPPMESIENWICGECAAILKAENVESRSVTMAHVTIDQLCMMLKHVVERMRDYPGSEPFWKAVDLSEVTNYLDYVVKPMDLTLLESNVRAKLYGSTDAFMADAKWIQHNCIVFNTCGGVYADTLKLTNAAKQLIKVARQEVSEMEACPNCYAHGRNLPRPMQSWFIEPCQRPHTLVWAKLKGFPFWPAKAMPRQNGQGFVDVRFFGAHDRAWVSPKDMYLYSREPPTSFPRKRKHDLDNCVKEIERHCQKLAMVFGEFTFAPPKIQYNPQDSDQIKLLLPHYDPSQPASKLMGAAMRKRSIANKKSTPGKRKSEDIDESTDSPMTPEAKKLKIETKVPSNGENKADADSGTVTPSTENVGANPGVKRRNGFFGEKSTSSGEPKLNNHPKKLSAILPSRISKRRSVGTKNTSEKVKSKESTNKSDIPDTSKKTATQVSPKTVAPITLIKSPLKTKDTASLINKSNVGLPQQQQSLVFFVVNNEKKAVKTVTSNAIVKTPVVTTTATTTMSTVTLPTVIKQEPKNHSTNVVSSPTLEENKREGKARKTFANKVPNFPQQDRIPTVESRHTSYPSTPMVIIPNYQDSRITYEMPPSEAGPLSSNISKSAHELARRMAQLMEESLKDIAQNNLVLQDGSMDSYKANIHSLQLKIEKLKWQHQEEITEIQHNYERKLKEMRSSLEAEMQRIIEETQKNAEEQRKKSIEETKRKQWCALCGKEANYYCCWNTSYCNYPCQQAHWTVHMNNCNQPAYAIKTNNTQQIMPKLVVNNVISSA